MIIPIIKSEKLVSIPFSNFPLLIQERFAEICDAQTLSTFSKINHRTKWISRKRKIVESFRIHDKNISFCCEKKDRPCSSFKDFDKTNEIFDELVIWEVFTEKNVKGIIKSYSALNIFSEVLDFNVFKHLIGSNLEECYITLRILPNMEENKLRSNLRMLVNFLFNVNKTILLTINLHEHEKLVEDEISILSKRPVSSIYRKGGIHFNYFIQNLETQKYFSQSFYA